MMVDQEQIQKWIAKLDSDAFGVVAIAHLADYGEVALEPVIAAYLTPASRTMHENARGVIVRLGSLAVPRLIELLAQKQGEFSIAWIFGYIHDPRVIDPLISLLTHKDHYTRWAAVHSLHELKATMAIEPLIKRLRDRGYLARSAATQALGDFGDERALEPLKRVLHDRFPGIQKAAAKSIEQITARLAPRPA